MATYRRRHDRDTWEIDFGRDGSGRRVRKQLPAQTPEREVRAIAKRAARERALSRVLGPTAQCPTLAEWAGDYCAWHELEYPSSHYRVRQIVVMHLLPTFGSTRLNEIRPNVVEAWKARRREEARAHTVAKELRVFRAVINRAVRAGMLERSPIEIVQAPKINDSKPPLFYTAAQMAALYEASSFERWHAPVWKLLANTGMRRGEALHARKDWIMGDTALNIQSSGEERTKSGEWRSIPLSVGAREAIALLAAIVEGPYILPRITPPSLSRSAAKCIARAGLQGSLHSLRHTYGSTLVNSGVPIRVVQRYMGHAHVSTTEIYAHLAPGFAADAAVRMAL